MSKVDFQWSETTRPDGSTYRIGRAFTSCATLTLYESERVVRSLGDEVVVGRGRISAAAHVLSPVEHEVATLDEALRVLAEGLRERAREMLALADEVAPR